MQRTFATFLLTAPHQILPGLCGDIHTLFFMDYVDGLNTLGISHSGDVIESETGCDHLIHHTHLTCNYGHQFVCDTLFGTSMIGEKMERYESGFDVNVTKSVTLKQKFNKVQLNITLWYETTFWFEVFFWMALNVHSSCLIGYAVWQCYIHTRRLHALNKKK